MFSKKKQKTKRSIGLQSIVLAIFLGFVAYVVFFHTEGISEKATEYSLNTINSLYGEEIDEFAEKHKLPPEYFKALIMLETSGRKKIPSRYEDHVFDQLKAVQNKKRKRYEHVTYKRIKNASDDALKNLASSWGPFQIMGYKCLELGITIQDLRGDYAIQHGMHWIKDNYGTMLKKKQFKDAFHYHNTGRRVPKDGKPLTHNPNYIINGLKYMEYYKQNSANKKYY